MFNLESRNKYLTVEPENVYPLDSLMRALLKLYRQGIEQLRYYGNRPSVPTLIAVTLGRPYVQAHLRAKVQKPPLNLSVRRPTRFGNLSFFFLVFSWYGYHRLNFLVSYRFLELVEIGGPYQLRLIYFVR